MTKMFCYRHPTVETSLRCNRCDRPICPKCAKKSPVGFRCPDCVREQEDKYYSGYNSDYFIASIVTLPIAGGAATLGTVLLGAWGFIGLMFAFVITPAVAGFIAEAVRWAVSKRRSRYLGHVVAGGMVIATLPVLFFFMIFGLFSLVAVPCIFIFVGAPTVYARLR
jgi:hypothetical protein